MSELIVLTSAGGKQAAHLIPHLLNHSFRLRLVVNSSSSQARLSTTYRTAEVVQADLTHPPDCRRILSGATAIQHVGPSLHPHETAIGYNMIDAAISEHRASNGNFKHFVYSSVNGTQLRDLANHDCKRYVEEYLMKSGLLYTILQPTNFMDVYPVAEWLTQEHPVYRSLWSVSTKSALLALKDYGEASAKVLVEREKHFHAMYNLAGTYPTSHLDAIVEIEKQIGKNVEVMEPGLEDGIKMRLEKCGPSPSRQERDACFRLVTFYNNYGLPGNPNQLTWLLGREPTSVKEWVSMQVEEAQRR